MGKRGCNTKYDWSGRYRHPTLPRHIQCNRYRNYSFCSNHWIQLLKSLNTVAPTVEEMKVMEFVTVQRISRLTSWLGSWRKMFGRIGHFCGPLGGRKITMRATKWPQSEAVIWANFGCHFTAHYAIAKIFCWSHTDRRTSMEILWREVLRPIMQPQNMSGDRITAAEWGKPSQFWRAISRPISRNADALCGRICDRRSLFVVSFLGFFNPIPFRYLDSMDHFWRGNLIFWVREKSLERERVP